jgi:hypothetical protein
MCILTLPIFSFSLSHHCGSSLVILQLKIAHSCCI